MIFRHPYFKVLLVFVVLFSVLYWTGKPSPEQAASNARRIAAKNAQLETYDKILNEQGLEALQAYMDHETAVTEQNGQKRYELFLQRLRDSEDPTDQAIYKSLMSNR